MNYSFYEAIVTFIAVILGVICLKLKRKNLIVEQEAYSARTYIREHFTKMLCGLESGMGFSIHIAKPFKSKKKPIVSTTLIMMKKGTTIFNEEPDPVLVKMAEKYFNQIQADLENDNELFDYR